MPNTELGHFLLALVALLFSAHLFGHLAERLALPRVAGEIGGGLLLGPTCLGHFAPELQQALVGGFPTSLIATTSSIGLVLLMFVSGFRVDSGLPIAERRLLPFLALAALGLPFAIGFAAPTLFDLSDYRGAANSDLAFALVFAVGFAVTSIPVISRIFMDLGIMDTRFSRLVLATATLEDIVLWIALSVALSIGSNAAFDGLSLLQTSAITVTFLASTLTFGPRLMQWLAAAAWNVVTRSSPIAFVVMACFALAGTATLLDVNIVFGALLAGMLVGRLREPSLVDARERLAGVAFATVVPLYFAIVGFRLNLAGDLDVGLIAAFLIGSSAVKLASVWLGARAAGCGPRAGVNLAMAMNARGGPGIVLGSLAFDAGIIDARLFLALVTTALLTSVFSGVWLRRTLRANGSSADDILLPNSQPGVSSLMLQAKVAR